MKRMLGLAAAAALVLGHSLAAQAGEGVSFSVGHTGQQTMVYRLGVQSDWDKSWWESSLGHLTGYWDGAYTYWKSDEHSSNNSLSFAPVFVYEFGQGSVKPFVEAGIGVSVFSQTQVDEQKFGTAFNFEDRLGVGVRFAGGHEVTLRAIHYSNAGIKEPNDGVEAYSLNYRMPL